MKVKILGCHGGVAPGYRTSSYMINDEFLIDSGSAASALTPQRQKEIKDIFLTHAHIDHVKDICFIIDNTFYEDRHKLTLRSTPEILENVHKHLFNDILWPDFSKIYVDENQSRALLGFEPFEKELKFSGLKLSAWKVNHVGPAIGYIVDDGKKQILFTGDTGPTDLIWEMANQCKNLQGVFTEISFPNNMDTLAQMSGHFTLDQLKTDLKKLNNKTVPIHIAHFKPRFFEDLMDEFHRLAPSRMRLLHQEDEFDF